MVKKKKDIAVEETSFSALIPHENNANQGTERGNYMLTQSFETAGIGRGIVVDRNNKIIGGNHAHAVAGGLDFGKAVIFDTDGDTLLVTRRTDCDLDADPGSEAYEKAHLLAIADNRTSEVNNNTSDEVLRGYASNGVDLGLFYSPVELDSIFKPVEPPAAYTASGGEEGGDGDGHEGAPSKPKGTKIPLAIALGSKDYKRWQSWKENVGRESDKSALLALLDTVED